MPVRVIPPRLLKPAREGFLPPRRIYDYLHRASALIDQPGGNQSRSSIRILTRRRPDSRCTLPKGSITHRAQPGDVWGGAVEAEASDKVKLYMSGPESFCRDIRPRLNV